MKIVPGVVSLASLLAFAIPSLAQTPMPMPGLEFRQRAQDRAVKTVQEALNLTEAQVVSLKGLLETRRQAIEAVARDLSEKSQALRNLLGQTGGSPDPTQVGNALLALQAVRKQIESAETTFESSFRTLLTSTQIQAFDALKKADSEVGAFNQLGLFGKRERRPGRLGFGFGFGRPN